MKIWIVLAFIYVYPVGELRIQSQVGLLQIDVK